MYGIIYPELTGLKESLSLHSQSVKSDHFALTAFAPLAEEFGKVKNFQGAVADVNLLWNKIGFG